MSASFALLMAVFVSLSVSTVLVVVLSRPLRQVLSQLCPGSDAATFWVAFTATMLYLAPLLFAMLFPTIPAVPVFVDVVRSALAASLFGAFSALLVVGYQVSRARPRTA